MLVFRTMPPGKLCSVQFPSLYPDIAVSFPGFQKLGSILATMSPPDRFRILTEPQLPSPVSLSSSHLPQLCRFAGSCWLAREQTCVAADLSSATPLTLCSVRAWAGLKSGGELARRCQQLLGARAQPRLERDFTRLGRHLLHTPLAAIHGRERPRRGKGVG